MSGCHESRLRDEIEEMEKAKSKNKNSALSAGERDKSAECGVTHADPRVTVRRTCR